MSEGEILVSAISGILGLLLAVFWFIGVLTPPPLVCPPARRWPLWLAPLVCAAVLLTVLLKASADDVRNDPKYVLMYALLGLAWVGLAQKVSICFGLYPRQDVIERRNSAAGLAVVGLLLGLTLCYAGGNIGNGPGWWVVIFCAALSTVSLLVLWLLLDVVVGLTDLVTINRDQAAGLRLGAALAACGLILGRSVAGDWVTAQSTVDDFLHLAWAALVVVAAEVLVSTTARPSRGRPQTPVAAAGVAPALAYLGFALVYVHSLGSVR